MSRISNRSLLTAPIGRLLMSFLVIALLIVACAAPSPTGQQAAAPAEEEAAASPQAEATAVEEGEQPRIALVTINQQALFFNQVNQGAEAAAERLGADLVIFNANNDPAAQNNAVETYTEQGVDAIIVLAIDVNGIKPALRTAKDAGIYVVAVDAVIPDGPQDVQVGVNNRAAGEQIGEFFVDYVSENMGGSAQVGIVGALNSAIQNDRQAGFESVVEEAPDIEIVDVVDGQNVQDVALPAAENLITANPDMNAAYATGEPALIALVSAARSQNATDRLNLFGWDLSAQAIQGIDEGFVVAVVQQHPEQEGEVAVESAMKLINGEPVEETIMIPVTIVTDENVDQFRDMFQ